MSTRPLALRFLASVAWRNLWRHRRRSLLTAGAMSVGVALCMATIAFQDGMFDLMFEVMVEQQLGHAQVHHPDYPGRRSMYDTLPEGEALLQAITAADGVQAAAGRLSGYGLIGGDDTSKGGQLVGIEPARDRGVSPVERQIIAGSYLSDEPEQEILLGTKLADDLKSDVGDVVLVVTQGADGSMGNEVYTVTGVFKSGNAALDRAGAFMHLADLQELLVLPDQLHNITVLTTGDIDGTVAELRKNFASDRLEVQSWQEASPQTAEMMALRDVSAFLILGIVFAVSAFGVLNTMMMSVFERTRELGVLKAIGLRPSRMVVMVVMESAFLAAISAAIGLVLGGMLDAYLVVYGLDFSASITEPITFAGIAFDPVFKGAVRPGSVGLVVVAVFVVSILASLFPAFRAARLAPVEAIRSE